MNLSSNQKAIAAAVVNAIIVGFSFIFVKMALSVSDPLDTLAHRFTLSFLAASLLTFPGWERVKFGISKAAIVIPLALLYPSLYFTLQAFGLLYTSSAVAGIIQATMPIFTIILATIFLKETTSSFQKIATLISVSGIILIFAIPGVSISPSSLWGVLLILISALSLAGYNVAARKLTRTWSPKELTYMITLFGFIFFNGMSIVKHGSAGTLNLYFTPFQEPKFIFSMLYLGVMSSLVTSFLSNYALSRMEASRVSIFGSLATVVSILAGVLLLNEQLEWYHWTGTVMIIAGVVGVNWRKRARVQAKK
jgi:drug/metabolite transporter (DMT)-like permease